MAPKPSKRPKPAKKFWLAPYTFGIQEAGPIREPILVLVIDDSGTNPRYYTWYSNFKVHAIDWALLHSTGPDIASQYIGPDGNAEYTLFSRNTDFLWSIPYEVPHPITIDALVPHKNRTQITIVEQREGSFLVRFIISYNHGKNQHDFPIEYRGKAPEDLLGKPFWGRLVAGHSRDSVRFLLPE